MKCTKCSHNSVSFWEISVSICRLLYIFNLQWQLLGANRSHNDISILEIAEHIILKIKKDNFDVFNFVESIIGVVQCSDCNVKSILSADWTVALASGLITSLHSCSYIFLYLFHLLPADACISRPFEHRTETLYTTKNIVWVFVVAVCCCFCASIPHGLIDNNTKLKF